MDVTIFEFVMKINLFNLKTNVKKQLAQSAEAVEYTICFFAEGKPHPRRMSRYDSKQSDDEASVMLELWGMSAPSLPSLPGSLWPRVVAPYRVLSMGTKLCTYAILNYLK